MLRRIRIVLASVFCTLLTLLLLDVTGTLHAWLGWMAKVQFLPAVLALNVGVVVALVVLTLIFGRIYCSVICPLGVMQDIFASWGRRAKKNRYSYSPAKKVLRLVVLALFLVALLAGVGSMVALLAPYGSYGRIVNNLFQPVYLGINNLLAMAAERMDSYTFYTIDVWIKSLPTFVIAAVTLVVLGWLSWRNGRTYCNTICPVGTVLGYLAKFSYLKICINTDKCNGCNRCARNCKAACIDSKNHTVDTTRCVACGDCIEKCSQGAITYAPARAKAAMAAAQTPSEGVDNSKRIFLAGALTVGATAVLAQEKLKVDGGLAVIEDKVAVKRATPIVPAGAASSANFYQHCTGCQLCVSACQEGVLCPSASLLTLMQPEMSYERGYCRPECTRCADACPAGAIRPITIEEKASTQIGHAVWVKKNCIVVTDGQRCNSCARHCPAGAITMVPLDKDDKDSLLVPAVNEMACIGCGACENLCPARPFSAIYVEGHEVHRTM